MLSYGYMPRGYNQVFSARMVELRNACMAKAREQGMGIVPMKVIGTGNLTGFLRTKEEYSDYKLELEWRRPEKAGNSGVLLHMGGEEKIWPPCVETQLMHKRAGDFVGMGYTINENKAKKGGFISYTPHLSDPSEKEFDEWNKYEITCKGDTIEATINGQLQNRATSVNIRKGYIGLQSEGVPIVFRNMKPTPLR